MSDNVRHSLLLTTVCTLFVSALVVAMAIGGCSIRIKRMQQQAIDRGYGERVYLSNGNEAFRWKEN